MVKSKLSYAAMVRRHRLCRAIAALASFVLASPWNRVYGAADGAELGGRRGNLRAVSREGSWPSPMAVLQETDSSSLEPFAIGNASVLCSSRMEHTLSSCDFRNRQRVEWRYGEGDDSSNCTDPLPSDDSIKCDHVAWHSGEGVAIGILSGVGMFVSLLFAGAFSRYKKTRTLRLGQPGLCLTFAMGIGVTCLSALMLLGQNSSFNCALRLWVFSAGFDLAFGALVLKLWRALNVVESSREFRRISVTAVKARIVFFVILAGDTVILALWTSNIGGKHCDTQYDLVRGAYIKRVSCVTCFDGYFAAWLAFKALLVVICWVMSYRTRKIQNHMAEGGAIAMATYNLCVAGLLVAAVIWGGANAQVRTTAEAVAIVLAGVGALCTVLAPRVIHARQELEGKGLVGPPAVGSSSSCDALYPGDRWSGTSGLSDYRKSGRRRPLSYRHEAGVAPVSASIPRGGGVAVSTGSGAGDGDDVIVAGGVPVTSYGTGNNASSSSVSGGNSRAVGIFGKAFSGHGASGGIHPDVRHDVEGSPPTVTTGKNAAASSHSSHGAGEGRPVSPLAEATKASEGGGARGSFATTGGSGGGGGLVVPDQSGFWTPPDRIRRTRSGIDFGGRSVDGMALAAAAAGAAQKQMREEEEEGEGEGAKGDEHKRYKRAPSDGHHGDRAPRDPREKEAGARSAEGGTGKGKGKGKSKGRKFKDDVTGSSKGGDSGEYRSGELASNASLPPAASSERRYGAQSSSVSAPGGAGGSKHPASGASGSSRASKGSSRGRTSTRPAKSSRSARASSAGSSWGGDSVRSTKESWMHDSLMLGLNGSGWSGGGALGSDRGFGAGGTSHRRSGGGGTRRSGRWSGSSSVKRAGSRDAERSLSMGSSSAGGRRSTAAGSLVMHADTGTKLHCPHCDKEVAGCGFRGCSGSLIRRPSHSDDEFDSDFLPQPLPPPLLPPLAPSAGSTGVPSTVGSASTSFAGGVLTQTDGSLGTGSLAGGGVGGRDTVLLSGLQAKIAANAFSPPGGGTGTGAGQSGIIAGSSSFGKPSRLRMSFRRGPPPSDTFDNEADSSGDDDYDDDFDDQRSALGISSPTSSSAWA